MGKVPFHFPEVEIEFMKSFAKSVGEDTRSLSERYVASDNVLNFSHGLNWESPANTLGDSIGEIKEHSTETELCLADIAAGKVEVVFKAEIQITNEMHAQMERLMIETVTKSTEKSGNVVNGANKTFPESMYEMLEMLEPTLDKDGELSMPTMIVHPSQSSMLKAQLESAGPEFEAKFSALKEKKKAEAFELEQQRLARFEQRYK